MAHPSRNPIRPSLKSAFIIGMLAVRAVVMCNGAVTTQAAQRNVEVDFGSDIGTIRPLHGVNNGPYSEGFRRDLSAYFKELAIPYVRLHEPNFSSRGCVHLQYIFPDMSADPDDPANYKFSDTDDFIAAVVATGAKPIYNLGFGNLHHDKRGEKYRKSKIPPADNAKIAKICVNIARHYNHGWANGFYYNIQYWDIWNEPNFPNHWAGSLEQYVELYTAVASAMKAADHLVKVGGPSLGVAEGDKDVAWLRRFLSMCRAKNAPLDFCSWHSYDREPDAPLRRSRKIQEVLKEEGYPNAENLLTEWSPLPLPFEKMSTDPLAAREFFDRTGGIEGGAYDAAVLSYLQDSPVDIATFYAGDTNPWSFIDRHGAPKVSYYAFKAFRQMLDTPVRVAAGGDGEGNGLAVLAGRRQDGSKLSLLIANYSKGEQDYRVTLRGLPWNGPTIIRKYLVDGTRLLELIGTDQLPAGAVTYPMTVDNPSVALLEFVAK